MSKHGYAAEMHEFVRSRTELECVVADMRLANESGEERRQALEGELQDIGARLEEVEGELQDLQPEWTDWVRQERDEKRRYAHVFSSPLFFILSLNVVSTS